LQVIHQRFEKGLWDARGKVGDEPDLVRTPLVMIPGHRYSIVHPML